MRNGSQVRPVPLDTADAPKVAISAFLAEIAAEFILNFDAVNAKARGLGIGKRLVGECSGFARVAG